MSYNDLFTINGCDIHYYLINKPLSFIFQYIIRFILMLTFTPTKNI